MLECFEHYEKLEENGGEDLDSIFKVNETKFMETGKGRKGGRGSRGGRGGRGPDGEGREINDPEEAAERKERMDERRERVMEHHVEELDYFLNLEDEYECSGMCKPALFYFGRNLDEGPPKKTCLLASKQFFSAASRSFAITSVLTGVVALFQFFFHFCLYCRPAPPSGDFEGDPEN